MIKMDPYKEVTPYTGPVLIVHGTKDAIVNLSYAKAAYEAYAAHSPDRVTLHIIEDGEHGFKGPHDDMAKQYLEEFAKL